MFELCTIFSSVGMLHIIICVGINCTFAFLLKIKITVTILLKSNLMYGFITSLTKIDQLGINNNFRIFIFG